jgi:hypothetical protein
MKRAMVAVLVLAALAGVATYASGHADYSGGPPASRTGAPALGGIPAELRCTMCHSDFAEDQPNGSVQILDLPEWYAPGLTYRLRVRLASTATSADAGRRWGFQLTAIQAVNGQGAGTFAVRGNQMGGPGGDTLRIVSGSSGYSSRRYVEHLFEGTRLGTGSPSEWSFNWTAPPAGAGTIYFYAIGNAANGSDDPSGDWIYTTADSMRDTTTAALPTSWGAIKARFR